MAYSNGAPAVVSAVLTTVNAVAENRNTTMRADAKDAIAKAGKYPRIDDTRELIKQDSQELQLGSDITPFLLTDLETTYGVKAAKVARDMIESFDNFLVEHFPTTYFSAAESWLTTALTDGGTGINAVVEDQLWARERSRTLREANRAAEEATASWAARGFAIPPGALVHQLAVIDMTAQEKIGEASRERAIKAFETELENTRLAVDKAIELRAAAINAAQAYMSALALAPKLGAELTEQVRTTREKLNTTLYEYHSNVRDTRTWNYSNEKYNLERRRSKEMSEKEWEVQSNKMIVDAVMAVVQSQGQQAAAALNGLHASAAVSGSDITNISVLG